MGSIAQPHTRNDMRIIPQQSAAPSFKELIAEFPLRPIRSVANHAKAKALALRLTSPKADRGTAEYLDVPIDLIADFERRCGQAIDSSGVTAAELVRHRIEQRGTSVSALPRAISVPQSNRSEMLAGKRDWSKIAIRGLSRLLNIRADRFLV